MRNIINKIAIQNQDGTYFIRSDIISEEKIPIIIEEHYAVISFKNDDFLFPITKEGIKIIENSYSFINNLLYYTKKISEIIQNKVEKGFLPQCALDHFYTIIDTYKELNLEYFDKNILIFNSIENYKTKTKMEISSLATIEILLRILNQDIALRDIKRLKDSDNYTPIIFPIKKKRELNLESTRDYWNAKMSFYTEKIYLADLIFTGHLQLNNYN